MNTALVSPSFPTLMLYAASLVLVMWTIVDVARRPSYVLPIKRKAIWITASVVMVHLSIQRCICSPACAVLLVIMARVTSATLGTPASAAVVSTGSVLRSAKAAIAVQTTV